MRSLPYWMMQPSAHLTFWDSQKPCEQITSSWSKLSPDGLPLLQESPHYVFSWDNAIRKLLRRWTSLLMPCWTLQTGRTLSWTLTCECALLATDLWPVCEQTIFKRVSYKHLQTRLKMRARLPNDWRQPGLPGGKCRHRTKLGQYTRLKATLTSSLKTHNFSIAPQGAIYM